MLPMCQGSAHEWVVLTEYNPLADEDVDIVVCSQCNKRQWAEDSDEPDPFDDYDPWGV